MGRPIVYRRVLETMGQRHEVRRTVHKGLMREEAYIVQRFRLICGHVVERTRKRTKAPPIDETRSLHCQACLEAQTPQDPRP